MVYIGKNILVQKYIAEDGNYICTSTVALLFQINSFR